MRAFALLFGIVFLFLGVAGFIPAARTDDLLFHLFKVNAGINLLYLLSAMASFMMLWVSRQKCILFFQILGSFYALMALFGFIYGNADILGIFSNNRFNSWLHMTIGIGALVLGYGSTD